jgi:N-acetyl-alpha-D-glucosaminyl L-malate synthase BshA
MARKTRIGISCHPTMGGSGVVATELGIALARKGYEVHFVAHSVPARLRHLEKNIYFHPVDTATYPVFLHPPYALALSAKLCEVTAEFDLDILHAHYAIPHAVGAYLAKQMARPRKVSTVVTLHGTDITLVGSQPSFFAITRFSIRESDRVTAVSEWLKAKTRDVFQVKTRICVTPNFVNTDLFTPGGRQAGRDKLAPDGVPVVMHASNFREVKNIPAVIEVFARIRREVKARLVMIGEGPEKPTAARLSHDLGIQDDVVFLGSIYEIEDILPASDLFLLPSQHESFGLVALEAMSAGVPVIATNRGGTNEFIRDGVTSFLRDPSDVEGMAEAGIRVLRDEDLRREMGTTARREVQEKFDVEMGVAGYMAVYESLPEPQ